jgi:hypothetical protein
MDIYTFQEHADMHLILDEPCDTGADTIRMCTERYLNPSAFNGTVL